MQEPSSGESKWSPAEWRTTDLSERAYDVGAVTGWILRVISHNRLEEGA